MRTSASSLTQSSVVVQRPVWRQMFVALGDWRCRLLHKSISRPVAGKYRCWQCLREFGLEW
jgi:hypothetical protein